MSKRTSDEPREQAREQAQSRRRRREQVFGDILPDTTSDEREPGAGDARSTGNDEWLKSNVPPHHG